MADPKPVVALNMGNSSLLLASCMKRGVYSYAETTLTFLYRSYRSRRRRLGRLSFWRFEVAPGVGVRIGSGEESYQHPFVGGGGRQDQRATSYLRKRSA